MTSHRFSRRVRAQIACATGLLLAGMLSSAGDGDGADSQPHRLAAAGSPKSFLAPNPTAIALPGVLTPSQRLLQQTESAPLRVTPQPPMSTRDLPNVEFRKGDTLAKRLAEMRRLPVMTLWQSPRTQVYLGVSQSGLAGLHFHQRRHGDDPLALLRAYAASDRDSRTQVPATALRSVSP